MLKLLLNIALEFNEAPIKFRWKEMLDEEGSWERYSIFAFKAMPMLLYFPFHTDPKNSFKIEYNACGEWIRIEKSRYRCIRYLHLMSI